MSPSRAARKAASLTPFQAARRLGISPGYLGTLERSGQWTYELARRAGQVYGCSFHDFFRPSTTPGGNARGGAALRAAACRGRRPRRKGVAA